FSCLSFCVSVHPRDLRSFPTRRSSDLWHSSVVTIPLHKLLQSASTRLLTGMIGAASLACRWPLFAGLSFLSGSVRSLCCSCTNIVASTKTWHLRLYLCSILAAHLAPLSEVILLVGGRVPPSS